MKDESLCDVPGCMKPATFVAAKETTQPDDEYRTFDPAESFCDDHLPEQERRRRAERMERVRLAKLARAGG